MNNINMQLKQRTPDNSMQKTADHRPGFTRFTPKLADLVRNLIFSERSELDIEAVTTAPAKIVNAVARARLKLFDRKPSKEQKAAMRHENNAQKHAAAGHHVKEGLEYGKAAAMIESIDWQKSALYLTVAGRAYMKAGHKKETEFVLDSMITLIRSNDPEEEKKLVDEAAGLLAPMKKGLVDAGNFNYLSDAVAEESRLVTRTSPERASRLANCANDCQILEDAKWKLTRALIELLPRSDKRMTEQLRGIRNRAVNEISFGRFEAAGSSITEAAVIVRSYAPYTAETLDFIAKTCVDAEFEKNAVIFGMQ
ncbi:Uncharacterised protein [uncultured archaeon]|nr:Uncharacterised protein [uncultured archaeon]